MKNEIGIMVARIRERAGFTQQQMCEGICSVSELAKFETDKKAPGHFELDRFFERAGKSTEHLEYVLKLEVYELYELQYLIQEAICRRKLEKAEALLEKYEAHKKADTRIHRQFIFQQKAQIGWLRAEESEKILSYLEKAVKETMPFENPIKRRLALCVDELKLLLFRWEVSQETLNPRAIKELWDIMEYLETHKMDEIEMAKIYPYVAFLLSMSLETEKYRERLLHLLKRAFEMLREEGCIIFLPEIMEQYVKVLKKAGDTFEEERQWIESARKELVNLEKEVGINLDRFRLMRYMNRKFELDYEVIRDERLAIGYTQARMGAGIWSSETLSRIEKGKQSPQDKKMAEALKEIGRERPRVSAIILTDAYDVLTLKKEVVRCAEQKEYEKMQGFLKELQENVNMGLLKNQQYIYGEEIKTKVNLRQISQEEGIRKLRNILQMTLKWKEGDVIKNRLTMAESDILNQIAICYCNLNEYEKGIQIWQSILTNFEKSRVHKVFRIREWSLHKRNLVIAFEINCKLDGIANDCLYNICLNMTVGKGNVLAGDLDVLSCTLEKLNEECRAKFFQTLQISKLMNRIDVHQAIKVYMQKHGYL